MTMAIPEEKRNRAVATLNGFIDHKKATVKELQQLCGYLNFLNRAVVPGRAFTRRMYAKFSQSIDFSDSGLRHPRSTDKLGDQHETWKLKDHHHVRLDAEFKLDCKVWLEFLTDPDLWRVVNRPMLDISVTNTSKEICFYSDASQAHRLGMGCILQNNWI